MPSFIAFLRAVNLGRNRKLPMADARAWLTEAGFRDVETYIQTGNIRLTTSLRARSRVEELVEQVLRERCGFDVPAMAFTPVELREVYDAAGRLEVPATPEVRRYLSFLKREPAPDLAAEIDALSAPGVGARVLGRAVYWWISGPSQAARLSNARIEKALGPATTRDLKVVTTLAPPLGGSDQMRARRRSPGRSHPQTMVAPAVRISANAASVVSGATPATRSVSSRTEKPS